MPLRPRILPGLALALAALASASGVASAANCANTSTGLVPLTDMGAGTYQGESGGLYGGGSNHRPYGHDLAGLRYARAVVPRDTFGVPDPVNGRVVLISIGMSNATQEFSAFVPKSNADAMRHPLVRVVDCAIGGQAANVIANPAAWYWDSVVTRLRGRGLAPAQVQAVWIKQANASPTGGFSTSSWTLTRNLGAIVRNLADLMPNLRLAYFTSRLYAGYASTGLNPEPYAYESGFAVRRLILAQAAGEDSLNHDPDQGPVESPWLAWGPYLWSDGLAGRGDGLTWACADFASDGTHPANPARQRVADSLLAFFRADDTTWPWYLRSELLDAPPPAEGVAFEAHPVPATDALTFRFAAPAGATWRIEVVDVSGRRTWSAAGTAGAAGGRAAWSPRAAGARPGLYFARLITDGRAVTRRLVVR